ncbi:hypothetical protein EG834_05330 [bacterium]|nr:hypothetical protein [bacterium]
MLLGNVEKIRTRFRGSLKGRRARVSLRTHFMTFHKTYADWSGEKELVIDAPPGPGWTWSGGENDGKIHGPLRLGEIQVQAGTDGGVSEIELEEVLVESSCPESKRCVLLAESAEDSSKFTATVRALSETPLKGQLAWVLKDWEGNTMGSGSSEITIPARTEPVRVDVALGPQQIAGKRFLEAEFTLNVPGQRVPRWRQDFCVKAGSG